MICIITASGPCVTVLIMDFGCLHDPGTIRAAEKTCKNGLFGFYRYFATGKPFR